MFFVWNVFFTFWAVKAMEANKRFLWREEEEEGIVLLLRSAKRSVVMREGIMPNWRGRTINGICSSNAIFFSFFFLIKKIKIKLYTLHSRV